ncbi:MAG: UDP-N-acetylmuramate--L-alanine ligase [Actinomycetes bacterium]|jgi:UDP-N-acetylmuramate--alanine ligase
MKLDHHRIHVIGAGGAGMSALAKILAGLGHEVTGSDMRGGVALNALADAGIHVATGHHPELAAAADLVVASSAVPDSDPEIRAAREAGVEVWRRPRLLQEITSRIPTIGATGTHGKTTTTALLVTALRSLGRDPSFVVGGELAGFGTNAHLGADDLLVLEVDEAFRTFESVRPGGLVVTNVEVDHLDHFGTENDLKKAFAAVASAVEGPVVCCLDDPGAAWVAESSGARTYGTAEGADWRIADVKAGPRGSSFTLSGPGGSVRVSVPGPGMHLVRNAAGALALLAELGTPVGELGGSLTSFRGVARRLEHRGTVRGVTLYDDYAHHPTEVAATVAAARALGPKRLVAVFQPHLYSRTERFHGEFGEALAGADLVVVTDVYGAREEPVPGVTGELVADAARAAGAEVRYVPHRADLAATLAPLARPGDLILTMGAGDVTLVHTELAPMLEEAAP